MTEPNVKQILDLPEKLVADLTGDESLEMQDLGGGPGSSKRIQLQSLIYRFGDVPNDGVTYARKNRAWFALPNLTNIVRKINAANPDGAGLVTLPASGVPFTPSAPITATDVQAAVVQVAGLVPILVRAVTTTTGTMQSTDAGGAIHLANAAAITFTIPTNATVPYPLGYSTVLRQTGVGVFSIVTASGVVLRNGLPTAKSAGQYKGSISLHKIGTDEWYLDGNVAAS
jgi:hypothetical protein